MNSSSRFTNDVSIYRDSSSSFDVVECLSRLCYNDFFAHPGGEVSVYNGHFLDRRSVLIML